MNTHDTLTAHARHVHDAITESAVINHDLRMIDSHPRTRAYAGADRNGTERIGTETYKRSKNSQSVERQARAADLTDCPEVLR